mgnify:CR=1 FL=1
MRSREVFKKEILYNSIMKEIEKGDWIEVDIKGYVEECKVRGFNERGIDVWDGVSEEYYIEWEEIDSVKKLGEEGLLDNEDIG